MNKIIELKFHENYKITVCFNDGEIKIIDFRPLIGKGVSSLLLDHNYFVLGTIDNGGGLEWPNGFDFCPNYLKEYEPVNEKSVY